MLYPCYLFKHAFNRIMERIPTLETIEQNLFSLLKIMIIILLISSFTVVIFWIFEKEDGIVVQPFETVGLSENIDGKSLATLLKFDLQRIKDIYGPVPEKTVDPKSGSGNMKIQRPLGELSITNLSIKAVAVTPLDYSLSQVVVVGTQGTSLSIGSLLYPIKEFIGNKADIITGSFQRYNSSIVAVAIFEDHHSPKNDIMQFEYCANISNVEQIPSLVNDLAFMIALELSKRMSQNEDDLYPQTWQTFKYVTQGRDAINNYITMKDINSLDKINYLEKGKNMALLAAELEPSYKGSFELLSVLGFAYLEMGEYDEALKIFKKTYGFKPFESALGLGLAYGMQGRYAEALCAFDDAIRQNSRDADAWNYKGVILSKQGNFIEAAKAFKIATTLNSQYEIAWRSEGDALAHLGENNTSKYDEALKAYEEAIKLNSEDELAWNSIGIVLHCQGKYDKAIKAYKKTTELNSSNAAAWQLMATSLYLMDKKDEALIAYNMSLQIKSNISRKMQISSVIG
jgi:tetratricopeptide (TPR) repeat protein